jgi:hypothetical protein
MNGRVLTITIAYCDTDHTISFQTIDQALSNMDIPFLGPRDNPNKAEGKPFELSAPDNRYVFVSDPEQIKELDNAPDTILSLQAASKQMLQPVYTM